MIDTALSWLSARASLMDAIYYPNFKTAFNGNIPTDKPISSWYGNNAATRQVGDFYVGFSNYMKKTRPIFQIIRTIGAAFGKLLYYIASGLQYFYVKMFSLFDIAGDHKGYGLIHDIYKWGNSLGLAIFGALLLIYVIGMIFNSPSWQRVKNIFRNAILILFFLLIFPWGTQQFTKGAQSVATNLLGINMSKVEVNGSKSTRKDRIDAIPDDIFRHNVVSVPIRLEHSQPGQEISSDGGNVFQEKRNTNAEIEGIKAEPLMVDLDNMSDPQVNKWNGLTGESIPEFLDEYPSNDNILNADGLNDLHTAIEKQQTKSGNQSKTSQKAKDYTNREKTYHPWSWGWNPGTWTGAFEGAVMGPDAADNLTNVFKYEVQNNGNGGSGINGQSLHEMDGVSNKGSIVNALKHSYSLYDVNWFAVYAGLIMFIAILVVYIYKTFGMLFKLGVMYASSGIMLFRNADNYQRIKGWMRDLFSIYEMLIMDIIMVRITMIVYVVINGFDSKVLMHCHSFAVANPWTIAMVDIVGDCALFMASLKGVNAVNTMVGSSGGGANSGIASLMGLHIAGGIAKHTVGAPFRWAGKGTKKGAAVGAGALMAKAHAKMHPGKANKMNQDAKQLMKDADKRAKQRQNGKDQDKPGTSQRGGNGHGALNSSSANGQQGSSSNSQNTDSGSDSNSNSSMSRATSDSGRAALNNDAARSEENKDEHANGSNSKSGSVNSEGNNGPDGVDNSDIPEGSDGSDVADSDNGDSDYEDTSGDTSENTDASNSASSNTSDGTSNSNGTSANTSNAVSSRKGRYSGASLSSPHSASQHRPQFSLNKSMPSSMSYNFTPKNPNQSIATNSLSGANSANSTNGGRGTNGGSAIGSQGNNGSNTVNGANGTNGASNNGGASHNFIHKDFGNNGSFEINGSATNNTQSMSHNFAAQSQSTKISTKTTKGNSGNSHNSVRTTHHHRH